MNREPLYAMIRQYEGLRLTPYYCPAGHLTVGFGHLTNSKQPITKEVAEAVMRDDAEIALLAALNLSPTLDGDRLCAIADFIFNLGAGRYKSSTLRKKVNQGDWQAARREIVKWVWGGGKKLPGLIARRNEEAQMLWK